MKSYYIMFYCDRGTWYLIKGRIQQHEAFSKVVAHIKQTKDADYGKEAKSISTFQPPFIKGESIIKVTNSNK